MYILIQEFQILFVRKIRYGFTFASGGSLVDRNLILFGAQSLVLLALDIEIGKFDGRNLERTGKAGYRRIFDGAGPAHPSGRCLYRNVDFGVVSIEIIGQFQLGVFQIFQVTRAFDYQFQGNGLVGFDVCRTDRAAQREVAYPTHERGGFTTGQRHDLDRGGIGTDRTAHSLWNPHGAEGSVDQLVGLDLKFVFTGIDGNLARALREEQTLFQDGHLVVDPVVVFQFERGVLRQVDVLYDKALERGEAVTFGLYARSPGVELDGCQDSLLLIDFGLGEDGADKEGRIVTTLTSRLA